VRSGECEEKEQEPGKAWGSGGPGVCEGRRRRPRGGGGPGAGAQGQLPNLWRPVQNGNARLLVQKLSKIQDNNRRAIRQAGGPSESGQLTRPRG